MSKTKPAYQAEVIILGKKTIANGKTAYDAFLNLDPGKVAGRAIVTVKKGKKIKERVIPMAYARRLFNTGGTIKQMLIKNFSLTFEDL